MAFLVASSILNLHLSYTYHPFWHHIIETGHLGKFLGQFSSDFQTNGAPNKKSEGNNFLCDLCTEITIFTVMNSVTVHHCNVTEFYIYIEI